MALPRARGGLISHSLIPARIIAEVPQSPLGWRPSSADSCTADTARHRILQHGPQGELYGGPLAPPLAAQQQEMRSTRIGLHLGGLPPHTFDQSLFRSPAVRLVALQQKLAAAQAALRAIDEARRPLNRKAMKGDTNTMKEQANLRNTILAAGVQSSEQLKQHIRELERQVRALSSQTGQTFA